MKCMCPGFWSSKTGGERASNVDLFDQLKHDAAPVSLAQLCAPFHIPVKQEPAVTLAELPV